jgi:hypothetical protein
MLNLSHIHVFDDPAVYPIVTVVENAPPIDNYDIYVEIPANTQSITDVTVVAQSSKNLTNLPENIWGFLVSENLPLVLKVSRISVQLKNCGTVHASSTTAEADSFGDALTDTGGANCKKFINTGLIDRYAILWGLVSLTHQRESFKTPHLDLSHPAVTKERRSQYDNPKIIFAKIAKRIEAVLDQNGEFSSANTNFLYESKFGLHYLLAVLNSTLMSVLYSAYFGSLRMSGGHFQFQAPQLRVLPIRRIAFTTPRSERVQLVEQGKRLYQEALERLGLNLGKGGQT